MNDLPAKSPPSGSLLRRGLLWTGAAAIGYLAAAYFVAPLWWKRYVYRHPALDEVPGITETKSGIPGDPLNVALVGNEESVIRAMLAAGWFPADPITLKSSVKIAADTVFHRPYDDAPVSSLFLFGRKEDLAFEKPVGHDPKQRNHVRFWKTEKTDDEGRPAWIGSATFDRGVGLSHTTGEITHHIAPEVDQERDLLFKDLQASGDLVETYSIPDFHKVRSGRNGGGDPWETDGALEVGVLKPAPSAAD